MWNLVKCYIWATFLYGCETWTLTGSIEKKITAFEMWIYRRISRTSWTDKVTNQHVLQKINIKSTELVQMIRTRKAKFYGHVRRHDSLQRVILEGKVEGKRGRGRKRTSWTDNIKTHLGLPINTCAELALDRKKWRAMTPNLGSEKEPGWDDEISCVCVSITTRKHLDTYYIDFFSLGWHLLGYSYRVSEARHDFESKPPNRSKLYGQNHRIRSIYSL